MRLQEPPVPDPAWPRYSSAPFPPYRFVPGRSPHPTTHPEGHSYGKHPELPPALPPERWRECGSYLRGVDLHNFAYWWECHEELEQLWNSVGRKTPQGQFLQGLIQVAAANLKFFLGSPTHTWLANEGLSRMKGLPARYMGMDIAEYERDVRDFHEARRDRPAVIRLEP